MSLEARIRVTRGSLHLDVELKASAGETVVLLGPNGAGKSTLVEALAGLVRPDEAELRLDGQTLEATRSGVYVPAQRRPIGMMFQGLWLFPHLSVRENIAYGLRARGWSRRAAREQIQPLLEKLNLLALADRRATQLSGGEAQRVALARALAPQPRLLLLDEPLSALDLESRARMRSFLQRLLAEFDGVRLMITHDPNEALLLADHLVILEAGRVVQTGPPEQVHARPRTPYVAALAGVNLLSGILTREQGRILLRNGSLRLPAPPFDLSPGRAVQATIPPAAVTIRPAGSGEPGAGTLEGRIEAMELWGEHVLLKLDTEPRLCAEIPSRKVRDQGLKHGTRVWATLDPDALVVYPNA
jgi:molybdate transport system ATP-binding protein